MKKKMKKKCGAEVAEPVW